LGVWGVVLVMCVCVSVSGVLFSVGVCVCDLLIFYIYNISIHIHIYRVNPLVVFMQVVSGALDRLHQEQDTFMLFRLCFCPPLDLVCSSHLPYEQALVLL